MKKFLVIISLLFSGIAIADTINLKWLNDDGTTYEESTCVVNNNLNIPSTPPTKRGHTFIGWQLLPYTPIEYLESTGTQYIDTGVKVDFNSKVEVVYQLNSTTSGWNAVYGNVHSSDGWFSFTINPTSQKNSYIYGIWHDIDYPVDRQKHTITQDKNLFYLDGILVYTMPTTVFVKYGNLEVFRRGLSDYPFHGRISSVKIYDNNTFVRDMISVLDENNTPCMYDRVEGKFYYNQGTGDFIAGPVVGSGGGN